jgi:hypothetical protein
VPSSPQLAAAVIGQRPSGSAIPAGTGVQVPTFPASAQLVHAWPQAVSQQIPSTQTPLLHSWSLVHAAAIDFWGRHCSLPEQ